MTKWKDVRSQARDAGIDPNDPAFLKYAAEAPTDRSLYDQISWAISKTRGDDQPAGKEAGSVEKKPVVGTSIDQALAGVRDENVI